MLGLHVRVTYFGLYFYVLNEPMIQSSFPLNMCIFSRELNIRQFQFAKATRNDICRSNDLCQYRWITFTHTKYFRQGNFQ